MGRVYYSPEADADLDEIWAYIAEDNPTAAERLIRTFDAKFHMLADQPRLGKPRDNLRPGLRSYRVSKYLLFYRPITSGIEVARVIHGARNIERLFAQGNS